MFFFCYLLKRNYENHKNVKSFLWEKFHNNFILVRCQCTGIKLLLCTLQIASELSYCNCTVVNHAKQFFSKENLIHSHYFFPIIFTLHPHFINPLHTSIERNIAYSQNGIAKSKRCFPFVTQIIASGRLKASPRLSYLLWSEFWMIIRMLFCMYVSFTVNFGFSFIKIVLISVLRRWYIFDWNWDVFLEKVFCKSTYMYSVIIPSVVLFKLLKEVLKNTGTCYAKLLRWILLHKNYYLRQAQIPATLNIFIVKWISNDNSNPFFALPYLSSFHVFSLFNIIKTSGLP